MGKTGKNYRASQTAVETRDYAVPEAVLMIKKIAYAKFDETVEVHLRLGVDARHAEQQVRETVLLPHGLGKNVRVLVFAQGEDARAAKEAGADFIADEDVMKQIQGGWTDFDAAVATPDSMGNVGRLGRILGPRGLMPNPKAGTVVPGDDLPRVIDELKSGRVEFRIDRTANRSRTQRSATRSRARTVPNRR